MLPEDGGAPVGVPLIGRGLVEVPLPEYMPGEVSLPV